MVFVYFYLLRPPCCLGGRQWQKRADRWDENLSGLPSPPPLHLNLSKSKYECVRKSLSNAAGALGAKVDCRWWRAIHKCVRCVDVPTVSSWTCSPLARGLASSKTCGRADLDCPNEFERKTERAWRSGADPRSQSRQTSRPLDRRCWQSAIMWPNVRPAI